LPVKTKIVKREEVGGESNEKLKIIQELNGLTTAEMLEKEKN
jgi:hypothetical protein